MLAVPMNSSASEITVYATYESPVVTAPVQYQEYICGQDIVLNWTKPTGTISHYIVSVRHLYYADETINELIVDKAIVTAPTRTYTIKKRICIPIVLIELVFVLSILMHLQLKNTQKICIFLLPCIPRRQRTLFR